MTSNNIHRTIFWITLGMSVATDAEAHGDGEIFYQVKQGI
jgi:hypothetical protein